jgi:septal ring factor EnvC (AmiA/AmiB activator)
MDADMDANNTTQYSPLNNLSSGDEVEQYTLPVTVNTNKPKRRRKRREFDSLKAQSMTIHKTPGMCKTSTCLLTFTLILLISLVCGLSVLVYQLYMQVHELQIQYSGLQNGAESRMSSLSALMSKTEDEQSELSALKLSLKDMNLTIEYVRNNLDGIPDRIAALEKSHADQQKPVGLEQIQTFQEKIAQFGSDVSSLQTDMDTAKQSQLSMQARIRDLDQLITSAASTTADVDATDAGE